MKLTEFTREALRITIGNWTTKRPNRRKGVTFDGVRLYTGHMQCESHVIHEIAHWLTVRPSHRSAPNYGLGVDPDTENVCTVHEDYIRESVEMAATDMPDADRTETAAHAVTILRETLHRMEHEATIVTEILCAQAGVPMRREHPPAWELGPACIVRTWEVISDMTRAGFDFSDPLRPYRHPKERPCT